MPAIKTEGLSYDIDANPFTTAAVERDSEAIAGKHAPTLACYATAQRRRRGEAFYRYPRFTWIQSSSALTDLGDKRRLRRLRLTLLRWLTRLGPRAMATPIASTSITTRWAIREVNGV